MICSLEIKTSFLAWLSLSVPRQLLQEFVTGLEIDDVVGWSNPWQWRGDGWKNNRAVKWDFLLFRFSELYCSLREIAWILFENFTLNFIPWCLVLFTTAVLPRLLLPKTWDLDICLTLFLSHFLFSFSWPNYLQWILYNRESDTVYYSLSFSIFFCLLSHFIMSLLISACTLSLSLYLFFLLFFFCSLTTKNPVIWVFFSRTGLPSFCFPSLFAMICLSAVLSSLSSEFHVTGIQIFGFTLMNLMWHSDSCMLMTPHL